MSVIERFHRIFYQKLHFTVTVRRLKYRIPTICYSNYRNTVQKICKYRMLPYRTPLFPKQIFGNTSLIIGNPSCHSMKGFRIPGFQIFASKGGSFQNAGNSTRIWGGGKNFHDVALIRVLVDF